MITSPFPDDNTPIPDDKIYPQITSDDNIYLQDDNSFPPDDRTFIPY